MRSLSLLLLLGACAPYERADTTLLGSDMSEEPGFFAISFGTCPAAQVAVLPGEGIWHQSGRCRAATAPDPEVEALLASPGWEHLMDGGLVYCELQGTTWRAFATLSPERQHQLWLDEGEPPCTRPEAEEAWRAAQALATTLTERHRAERDVFDADDADCAPGDCVY